LIWSGIEYNGKHSYRDFGLTLESRKIGNPSKNKILESVPFSNTQYDFSSLYGDQEYLERELTYVFNITGEMGRNHFYVRETDILHWLMPPSKKIKLKDDKLPGFYFMAEVMENPDDEDYFVGGKITITFTAYPFKIADHEEGHDRWDDFNFLWDVSQTTAFTVSGRVDTILHNPGAKHARPNIQASANMQIMKEGVTYQVKKGESSSFDFVLKPGPNQLRIIGNGTISFHYRKEMI
jgi:phage-related protein